MSIHQEDITVVNIFVLSIGACKYIKQILTDRKGEIGSNTIMEGDLYTPISTLDRSSRKINKELDLNYTLDQMNLADTYRTCHPTAAECTFFSSAHGTFSRIDHILDQNTSPNKFKKSETLSSVFF